MKLPKQKFSIRYFLVGATLGLITLAYQNRDLLPEVNLSRVTPVMFQQATPTPYHFEDEFMNVCEQDSGNKEYCQCSRELLMSDEAWNDGRAEYLYNEVKEELDLLCMKSS